MKTQMKRLLHILLVISTMLVVALPANASGRFRGGFYVGPFVRPWGWYQPYYYGPYYGSYYGPYAAYPNAGQVKLDINVKDAQVYINGAYAGTAGKLKSMWLRPNTYDLEIRAPGCVPYAERIYVVAGKTLKLHADLQVEPRR